MKKFALQAEIKIVLAKQVINYSNQNFIEWALQLLENGYCSDNSYILAGLDSEDCWTIELYFKKVLEDFNLDLNIQEREILDFYFIYKIKEILENPLILSMETINQLRYIINYTSFSLDKHFGFLSYTMN